MVRSEKTSSAVTVGWVEVRLQVRRPLWPSSSRESRVRVASMSAAVVPGAKLVATTVQGPAFPLMLRPPGFVWARGGVEMDEVEFRA